MHRTVFTVSAVFFLIISSVAQSMRYTLAQPYISLSAYSIQQKDALSFSGNQAALATVEHAGMGVYGERRFMLSETSVYTGGASVPTELGNFGLLANYAGFKNFSENKIGLAYARQLGKTLDVGAQFNYYSYRVPAYQNAAMVNFEIGVIMHLTEKLSAGVHVYNPVGGNIGEADEKLASAYKAGVGFDASEQFFVSAEIVKQEDKPVNVIGGFQYQFDKQFFFRAGFISETSSAYGGAGIKWKNIRLDVTAGYHPQLGFTPGLLFLADFKKKEK